VFNKIIFKRSPSINRVFNKCILSMWTVWLRWSQTYARIY